MFRKRESHRSRSGPDLLQRSVKQRLDAALQLLSDQERTAFLLRHFEGQSIEEIGAILNLGVSATKNSIFKRFGKFARLWNR